MTQFGVWVTNKPVPFQRHRRTQQGDVQEGVVNAGDYKVSQRAAGGANMSVDIAIGDAFVAIDTGTKNGLGYCYSDAIDNVVVANSDATNPRVDQLVLQWNDSSIPTGVGGDVPSTRIITGTPTAAATLDNRNGAVALPADCVRLADVLVPAASATVTNANIRDRRPWARGAFGRWSVTSGDIPTTSAAWVAIAAALGGRLELSGQPVRITLRGSYKHSVASAIYLLSVRIDGTQPDGASGNAQWQRLAGPAAPTNLRDAVEDVTVPAAPSTAAGASSVASGSHLIDAAMATPTAGTLTASAVATVPQHLTAEELVRQVGDNT